MIQKVLAMSLKKLKEIRARKKSQQTMYLCMTGGLEHSVETTTDPDNIVESTVGPEDSVLTMETEDTEEITIQVLK